MSTNRHIRRLTVLMVLLLSTLAFDSRLLAQSSDEAAIRKLVESYFAAYAREDLDAITHMWSDKAPDLAQNKARLKEAFSVNDANEIKNLQLRRFVVEGEHAKAIAEVVVNAIDAKTGKPAAGPGRMNRSMSFAKEAGEWKVWRDTSAEEELAARLVAAQSDGERRALVSEEPQLMTPELVRSLTAEGQKLYTRSNYPQALAILQLSYQIAEQIKDQSVTGRTLMFIGHVYNLMGDYDIALAYYDRVVKFSEATGYKGGVARAMLSIGTIQQARGQLSLALASDYKALAEFEKAGDKRNTALTRSNLGVVYIDLKDYAQATEHYLKALALFEELRDESLLPPLLSNIGNAYAIQGDYASARKYHERSLALNEKFGDRRSTAAVLNSIGDTLLQAGKPDEALEYFQKSLKIKEEIGSKDSIIFSLNDIASANCARGAFEKALEPAKRAAAMSLQIGNEEQYRWARSTAGKAHLALHQTTEARQAFDDAIATTESLRKQAPGGEREQQLFFEDRVSPYYQMIGLLAQNKTEEALNYAERAKARVLLDVLQSGKTHISNAMNQQEREQESRLRAELTSLNAQLRREGQSVKTDQSPIEDLKAKLAKARLTYEGFQTQLYVVHPELKVKRGEAQTLSVEQAGELLTDSRTALLEYAVAGDRTFLFVLTASPQKGLQQPVLNLYDLHINRKDLAERVQKLNQRIANNDLEYAHLSSELYNLLIAPARQQLLHKTSLVIVPDDILWETPFQALRSGDGRFLVQQAAISYAPSLTVLREIVKSRKQKSSATLLAIGNPELSEQTVSRSKNVLLSATFEPLPDAERMVKELGQMYGSKASKVYVGGEAREEVLKAESRNYRILQLATHGVINNASPMYSYIVLAQSNSAQEDGLLEAWEIMKLDLQADLAVLSACETARGKIGAGEGVIGLAWALFVAGCPTTVVSQWKVESSSTTELMLAFHRNLQAGSGKSEAMRLASLKLMADKRYNHPFYWAGFIVVGDPQ